MIAGRCSLFAHLKIFCSLSSTYTKYFKKLLIISVKPSVKAKDSGVSGSEFSRSESFASGLWLLLCKTVDLIDPYLETCLQLKGPLKIIELKGRLEII